uniref:Uncharacterized protein n=1 Tax=Magallana gigas TaxID=29159 RepID=K1QB21_MAGGI
MDETRQLFLKKSNIKGKCFGLRSMRRSVDGSLEDKVASNEEGSSRSLDLVVVNIVLPMFRVTTSSCFAMKSLIFRDSILVGKRISKAFEVAGCTGKAAEVEVSGPLDAVAGFFGVRESPEGLGTDLELDCLITSDVPVDFLMRRDNHASDQF